MADAGDSVMDRLILWMISGMSGSDLSAQRRLQPAWFGEGCFAKAKAHDDEVKRLNKSNPAA